MSEAFVSWSGGKDSCLACYRAITSGMKIRYLLNMVTDDGQWSRSHGLSTELIRAQSEAMGIPVVQKQTGNTSYEEEFKNALAAFKLEGINSGIFGDIDFNEHRGWIERVCSERDITPHLPLWEQSQEDILNEFIRLGFKSIVVATKADLLGPEWLGRIVDNAFLEDLKDLGETKEITLCGEAGEYHSYVIDGPLFNKRIEIIESSNERKNDHWFLRINKYDLKSKSKV